MEDPQDLAVFILSYLKDVAPHAGVQAITKFYLSAREEADKSLCDGANQRPRYSLRTLARTLDYCRSTTSLFGFQRALYEGVLDSSPLSRFEKLVGQNTSNKPVYFPPCSSQPILIA